MRLSYRVHTVEEKLMPSGHASHKSTSIKPNTNTSGLTNAAAGSTEDPHDIVTQGSDPTRPEEALENRAATKRPEDKKPEE